MQVLKLLWVVVFVVGSTLTISAQQNELKEVQNPNIAQKRLNQVDPVRTTPQPRPRAEPMAMALKYEETAIRKWKKENPKILFMTEEEYAAVPANRKELFKSRTIIYESRIKWSDIEKFEELKK